MMVRIRFKLSKMGWIKNRIDAEHKKHKSLDWSKIAEKKILSTLKQEMFQLDWMKILNRAIESRRTSWGERPVQEWRNASDEVLGAVINAMQDKKLIQTLQEEVKEFKEEIS